MRITKIIPAALWLAACAAFLVWALNRPFHVGQMLLPKDQAAALAVAFLVGVNLVACWVWLGYRALARWAGLASTRAWIDRPGARAVLLSLLVVCAVLLLYGRLVEPRWVKVQEVRLGDRLPEGAGEVRIAVLSDLHVEGDREPWRGLAQRVNHTDPDLILLLGDTINRSRALPTLRRILRRMKASHGKYAVWGNWEAWYWSHLPLLKGTGFSWLHRRRVTKQIRGQVVHLVGLPLGNNAKGAPAERLLARAKSGWRIFLYHTPDLVEEVPSADLYLAGHTHGGQVAIPFYGALVTLSRFGKRFERGLYLVGQTHLYVNPGIGVEPAVPVRLGVRPEVTLIILGSPPRRR